MGLFELLRGGKDPTVQIESFLKEAAAAAHETLVPANLPSGRALLEAPPADLAATMVAVWKVAAEAILTDRYPHASPWLLVRLAIALQEKKPPLTAEQLGKLVEQAIRLYQDGPGCWLPVTDLVTTAESLFATARPAAAVVPLERLRDILRERNASERRLAARIDMLLTGAGPLEAALFGPFGRRVAADLAGAGTAPDTVAAWKAVLAHGLAATAAKPSARWLKQAKPLLEAVGPEAAAARLGAWLDLGPCPGQPAGTRAADSDADLIKGLLFAAAALGDVALAPTVANLASASLRKIPNLGPVSARVGNACIYVLSQLPGPVAIAQLGRLRLLVKYATARRLVEKALEAAAERAGVTAAEIEEMSVPTYGLDGQGVSRRQVGDDVTAEIAIADDEATLTFRGANGKVFKSVPASVKQDHATALAELRRTVKEIGQVLPAQRLRLENLMNSGRELTVEQWRVRYLEHPLIGDMARRLIWSVTAGGTTSGVLPVSIDGRLIDAQGAGADVADDARVQLYHPLRARPEETLAWRRLLESRELTQPFKQAHREVYLLTDAELVTSTYSNRFAGHIVRQHQLAALCRDRGWQYHLQGAWDSSNNPFLRIPGTNLTVEFWTEMPQNNDAPLSGAGIYMQVATDQVRFRDDTGEVVPLAQIPPLILSEIMRDVDLFVSVASIGTDPNWRDQGDGRAFGEYWQAFAFGELGASATTRRAVLESVVPKLKIRDRCSFDDRHLVVRGELATYRIHLGSGNVLIEPGSRYLCIVPDSRGLGARVNLPFKGDGMLAIILSKAFLLAADREITDPTIVRQIQA